MDILNLSTDDNEADTSQDELQDDDDEDSNCVGGKCVRPEMEIRLQQFGPGTSKVGTVGSQVSQLGQQDSSLSSDDHKDSIILNEFQDWERPEIPEGTLFYTSSVLQEQPEAFQFYFLDCVSTVSQVKHPNIQLHESIQGLPMHNVIRFFGVAKVPKVSVVSDGEADSGWNEDEDETVEEEEYSASVCCNLHGFLPYFYAAPEVENEKELKQYWTNEKLQKLRDDLNERLKNEVLQDLNSVQYHEFVEQYSSKCVVQIEVFDSMESEEGIYHMLRRNLRGSRNGFAVLKIFCSLSCFVWKARKILEDLSRGLGSFECFEHNINNTIRFITSMNIPGCSWMEATGGKYYVRLGHGIAPTKESHCQIEIDTHYCNLRTLPNDHHRYDTLPPLRVLSFDIEVLVTDSVPRNGNNQVIQIGNVLGTYKSEESLSKQSIIGKSIFVVGRCEQIADKDTKLLHFYSKEKPDNTNEEYLKEAEATMLAAWREFVVRMDPDIITGYNIKKFDVPYLIDRSNVLKHSYSIAKILPKLGRLKKLKSIVRPLKNPLKKAHTYDEVAINIQGRVMMDLYPVLIRHDKRSSAPGTFSLSNVAKRYLNQDQAKLDVHFSEINGLHHGTSSTRKRLAEYCLQDSLIPFLLLFEPTPCHVEKIRLIDLYCRRAQNSGNLLRYLLNKSPSYNDYFKQLRLQKNPGKVVYQPDTPSPKKPNFKQRLNYDFWARPAGPSPSPTFPSSNGIRPVVRNLFPDK